MRILPTLVFIIFTILGLYGQDLVAWAPSTNNMTVGQSLIHVNMGVNAIVGIVDDGNDGVSNIQVLIFDNLNVLQETVIWPSNPDGSVLTGWKAEYVALSGQGSSCMDGGKDWFYIQDNNVNTYSNIDHCVKLAPMPITYQNQPTAKLQYDQTHITWSVATQINNDKYIIEQSNDGKHFSSIVEIAGDGTSNTTKHYVYIHKSPYIGNNYYRIKQVDYDGKYSYSDIASVRYDGNGETSIYPNPASSEVTVEVSEPLEVLVTDIMGRVLHKQTVNKENNVVDLSGMPSGLLIFSLQNGHKVKVLKD